MGLVCAAVLRDATKTRKPSQLLDDVNAQTTTTTTTTTTAIIKQSADDVKLDCNRVESSRLVILVHTSMNHRDLRDAIRSSWGNRTNLLRYNASLYFVIGKSHKPTSPERLKELSAYSDLIQLNFIDNYRNLSRKSVESLKWVHKRCPAATYVLKQDDDTFVDLQRLTTTLNAFRERQRTRYIGGFYFRKRRPIRNRKSRYYTPYSLWNHTSWPAMVTEPAYVMTSNVIPLLLRRDANATTPRIPYEDVYVTGVLRYFERIAIYSIPNMTHRLCSSGRVHSDNGTISYHRVHVQNHYNLFHRLPCVAATAQNVHQSRE